jgi:proteasome assembly chaperone (PAC2) family protein
MGEIPDYLSGIPFPYPRASKAVLEILGKILGMEIDYGPLEEMSQQVDEIIRNIYEKLPLDIKDKIEQRKLGQSPILDTITEEDEAWLKEHLDELFKGGKRDERPS